MSADTSTRNKKARYFLAAVVLGAALWATHDHWRPLLANTTSDDPATESTESKKPEGVPVMVEAVGETRDEVVIEAIGTARALRSVSLYPEASGEVTAFPAQSGNSVAKNDVIMRLDNRNAALSVRVSETRVKEAESALERAKQLRRSNVRSSANVEDAEIILERAKLELRQAQEGLADRTLRAPFAGIVGIPSVEIGDRVATSTEIITLDDRNALQVEFEVAERYLSRLILEMAVEAQTPSLPNRRINGKIDKIDSRVDPVSRTVRVRAHFANEEDGLRPGMSFFVNLKLPGPVLPTVPELALQWRDGQSYIWAIVDGAAKRIDVAAQRRLNKKVLIKGDIQPGDIVVVEGVQRLRPGRAVEISAAGGG